MIQTDIVVNIVGNVKSADEINKRLRDLDKNAAKSGSETQKLTAEFKRLIPNSSRLATV